jgi:hypothetical protein
MTKTFYRSAIALGFCLFAWAGARYIMMNRAVVFEQSPSSDDGVGLAHYVAARYGQGILITASGGCLRILAGVSAFTFQRLRQPS